MKTFHPEQLKAAYYWKKKRVTETLCSFKLFLEGKTGKKYLSHQEFPEKFSGNIFGLSDVEDNTSGAFNSSGIADLHLLRTLLAICQESWEPNFWEVLDSFV